MGRIGPPGRRRCTSGTSRCVAKWPFPGFQSRTPLRAPLLGILRPSLEQHLMARNRKQNRSHDLVLTGVVYIPYLALYSPEWFEKPAGPEERKVAPKAATIKALTDERYHSRY